MVISLVQNLFVPARIDCPVVLITAENLWTVTIFQHNTLSLALVAIPLSPI